MQSNLLKGWLKANGLNYREAAELTGLSTNSFCNKVNGNIPFKLHEIDNLIKASTVHNSPEELFEIFFTKQPQSH